uniref:PuwB n=1 Tax=Cylindrospermum alatosporum CCALA 994 TaxID=1382619 RepID=A0A346GB32_9NOST|nr:PuwB [Cylindrospermum alatosporum CCALA 994]
MNNEPIAIIGIGCRFPGIKTPEGFWHLLRDGVDAISEVPKTRWDIESFYDPDPAIPGKMSTKWGGFLEQVDQFDPQFFGISPREAVGIDPQQRLSLEVAWEALEDAGQKPEYLVGKPVGVFTGVSTFDYYWHWMRNPSQTDVYFATGIANCMVANRISYTFNFTGPSLAIDTACSSSLVAVHLACQSLANGESTLALAGGVNVMTSPWLFVGFSKSGFMAPDGRCKTFDSRANGYVRSEGGGFVVLKLLSQAVADGDRIYAVIRGSAINQDGRSNGLTAPNSLAQEAVLRDAYRQAGVSPGRVQYIEAHGTGTKLGDPIEMKALGKVLSEDRPSGETCAVGAVKTNIGHTEAAAGIAGLIKVALSLQNQQIPPSLHFLEPNPYIPFDKLPLRVQQTLEPWPTGVGNALAGVSSFGFGGTNAHVVLEAAPQEIQNSKFKIQKDDQSNNEIQNSKFKIQKDDQSHRSVHLLTLSAKSEAALQALAPQEIQNSKFKIQKDDQSHRSVHLLTLSAKSEAALQALAASYQEYLQTHPDELLANVCFTSNTGRSHFEYRLAIATASTQELSQQLEAFTTGSETSKLVHGRQVKSRKGAKIAFLFTGQGSQYIGMGWQLYETQPSFRSTINHCEEILRPYLEKPLLEILYPQEESGVNTQHLLDETAYTQPALFVIEYAIAKLWQSWGIEPTLVIGHSVGEYVAACIAGVFTLEDGLKLIAARGRLMQALPQDGAMVAILADEKTVLAAIQPYGEQLSIAAINGAESLVISGQRQAIESVCLALNNQGVKTKPLKVSHAFHSPLMKPILGAFEEVAKTITYSSPKIPLISNATGQITTTDIATPEYWCRHICQPVKFAASMETLQQQGYEVFVEIGPKPTLLGMGRQCLPEAKGLWLPSLHPRQTDWQQILESLAALYIRGIPVDWVKFNSDYEYCRVSLPTYPFQRQRYWLDTAELPTHQPQLSHQNLHPLLGQRLQLAGSKEIRFESHISQDQPAYLKDHCVFGEVIFPAAAYLEMVLAAGAKLFKSDSLVLEDVSILQALILSEEMRKLQLSLTPQGNAAYSFQIFSCSATEEEPSWMLHVSGKLLRGENPSTPAQTDLEKQCQQDIDTITYYQQCSDRGIDYGFSFQAIEKLWQSEELTTGKLQLPLALVAEIGDYTIHPVLLDACFQLLGTALPNQNQPDTYLPIGIERLQIDRRPGNHVWSQVQINPPQDANQQILSGDLSLYTPEGQRIAQIKGFQLQRANHASVLNETPENWQNWLYQVEWRQQVRFISQNLPPDYLPSPQQMSLKLSPHLAELVKRFNLEGSGDVFSQLEKLSLTYVIRAFADMKWKFQLGQRFSTADISTQLGVINQHQRLLGRLLEILDEGGYLRQINSQWEVIKVPQESNPEAQLNNLFQQYPTAAAELTLLGRCGCKLADVLRGNSDPLQLLFPEGDLTTATQVYQDSPGAKLLNTQVQQAISSAVARLPKDRGVRVLEIGAGTGGTTTYILPVLPAQQTEYVFTDLSPRFTTQAEEKFQEYPFVKYQVLDIEQDLKSQGFEFHQYDVIVAANVLHATQDLRQTLQNIRQLLAPNGLLVLLEGTARQRWLDLTFGLTEGWWWFTDTDLRPNYPLLTNDQWQNLLLQVGYQAAVTLPLVQESQSVIVAQAGSSQLTVAAAQPKHWLLLCDHHGLGEQLAAQLRQKGEICTLVFPGELAEKLDEQTFAINPQQPEDFQQLLRDISYQPAIHGVVHCWSLDTVEAETLTSSDLQAASQQSCGSTLHLVQGLVKASLSPRLWLVTRGAQSVGDAVSGVAKSAIWGLGKVIALEHPELKCVRVDLDPDVLGDAAPALFAEVWADDAEDQVAFRNGLRYVARLVRSAQSEIPLNQPFTLTIPQRGTLENLTFQPAVRRLPGVGEVEIRVRATGLNFRDLLNALDLYPGDPGPLGGECAGEIVAIGAGVAGFAVGDAVIAIAPATFSQYATVNAALVAPKPTNLSFEEATTIPITFLTAYYALHHLAKIAPGERVLIHAAAGGVGQAAIQLAQQVGAEVFATASPGKWEFLQSLGVQHIMNSRTVEFAEQIGEITGGEGVNIVLNSLTSDEFIAKSLSVLSSQGRFVEIAKRGVLDTEEMLAVRSDIAYFLVDLVLVCQQQPALIQSMLRHLMPQFAAGKLKPLPQTVFPIQNVVDAFRYMQQAKHIGKIVVTQPAELTLRSDRTYLITGGMGGLGLLIARWMVENGAKHLVLLGRSAVSESAIETLEVLQNQGAEVMVVQADVTDVAQMTQVIAEIERSHFPLRGVIHAVGVLDDGVLQQQTWERFARVMAPKVEGAWHLHQLTQNLPLDFFVLFSSVASLFGSPGQANHAAANGFLDALAAYRQQQGLPGLSINWGVVADIGAAAKRQADGWVKTKGMGTISPSQVLEILAQQLQTPTAAQVGVVPVDWSKFIAQSTPWSFFSDFQHSDDSQEQPSQNSELRQQLEVIPKNEQRAYLTNYLCTQVAKVLGLNSSTSIDIQQGFFDLGMDSLTSVELRNRLQTSLGCSLPSTLTFKYPTVAALVDYLAVEVLALASATTVKITLAETKVNQELEAVKQLSKDELDDSIAQEIAELEALLRGN